MITTSRKISLRTAWYGIIALASLAPAIVMTPWLGQQAHNLLLNQSILEQKLIHNELEVTLALETRRITSVLANQSDLIVEYLQRHNQDDAEHDNTHNLNNVAQSIIDRDTFISTVTIYNKNATVIGASHHHGHTGAVIHKDTPSFATPMQGHDFIGSASRFSDGHFELVISVPVYQLGVPTAVLVGTINTNQLWDSILKGHNQQTTTTYLVDSSGSLLIDMPNVHRHQGDLLSQNAIVRHFIEGKTWNSATTYKGLAGTDVFGISSLVPTLHWGIISEVASKSVVSPIIDAMIILTIIIFILHIIFGLFSIIVSRFLLRPVSDLVDVMKDATSGDYKRIDEHRQFIEIAALTSSFNTMIGEIQHRETSLLKLSQAIEQAGESVIITDVDGTIEYVNPSFTKITGYLSEDVMGKNPRILKSGNQPAEYYKSLWETISSGNIWRSSIVDRRKDGSLYPAIATISPIFNAEGRITHYVGTQQDMTENKQLEEKFRQSQKMEAIGVLVGGIAHDFNNMLAAVTSHLHLTKELSSCSEEVKTKIEIIERLTFAASDMVKQLLMFSRKAHVEMRPFGLISFAKEVSKICRAGVPENIQFNLDFADKELIIKGDATQLQQVLMNLINNAKDALHDTKNPAISLSVNIFEADEQFALKHPDELHREFAHIVVKDNGHGIAKADKAHIFDPFYTTKEVGLGTGLGLSMAYGVIQNHEGIIEVDSVLNEETAFHIYLPLLEIGEPLMLETVSKQPIPGNGELILLVDDNNDVRHTAKTVLEKLGYRIIEAFDGLHAIDLFNKHKDDISLIITDVVMPKMGGVQAIEQIRKVSPLMKVIFITGYDAGELVTSTSSDAPTAIVTKPYRVHHLSKVVSDLLN